MTGGSDPGPIPSRLAEALKGRFEVLRELTGGGMSRVFLARDVGLDRQIVIKILPPELAAEVNRDRFRREVQLAARLHHPHIVPLFSAAEEAGMLYYTMPYIKGESIREQLASGRRFSISETLEILVDVADALAYAHAAGVAHRDIKPANVLREGGHAVVTDFGVAKALTSALGSGPQIAGMTTSGVAIGTPAYMAPEQLAGETSADHRVDIYALGLLGYELLTGTAPFRGPSPQAMLAAQLTRDPEPVRTLRPETPPVLAALIARCLEKEPSRRPQSAETVLEVLRTIDLVSGSGPVATTPRRIKTRVLWPVIGVLAAVFLVVIWQVWPTGETQQPVPIPAARAPDTPVTKVAGPATDSTRILAEQLRRRDERLMRLLRDSIANALRVQIADSVARARDSVERARPGRFVIPEIPGLARETRSEVLTPEAFRARAASMGPPRRVSVAVHSSLRSPAVILAAGVIRDSILNAIRGPRFIPISPDTVAQALQRSRSFDSLRVILRTDLFVTINASGSLGTDSLRWNIQVRDFSAHTAYASRSANSLTAVAIAEAAQPAVIQPLVQSVVRNLDEMDRAPRRREP